MSNSITPIEVKAFRIDKQNDPDPIFVFIENYTPGQGQITIRQYDLVVTTYWGNMSGESVEEFFLAANPGYLSQRLAGGKRTKREAIQIANLVTVVREALKEPSNV